MDTLLQDVRFAWRSLRRTPGFTLTVIAVMALGIGVNSMIFSVVRTILLAELPFPHVEQLVRVDSRSARNPDDQMSMSFPDLRDVRARTHSFQALAGFTGSSAYPVLGGEPERFRSTVASANLTNVLGVRPVLGRWFIPDEELDGHQYGSVVIGWKIWKERLNGDPNVIGRPLRMNGRVRTIVGVMPEGFRFPETSDFFTPLWYDGKEDSRGAHYINTIARLRPGVTRAAAQAEVGSVAQALEREYPKTNKGITATVLPYRDELVADIRPVMLLLQSAVAFVLLIACANVANLLLARSASRQREMSVRVALGATRARIVQQLLCESVLLALVGGALGVLLAGWGLQVCLAAIPEELPYWMHFGIDRLTLLFTVGLTLLAGIVFGIAPAWQVAMVEPRAALAEGSAAAGDSPGSRRMRHSLVVAEIALAVVLLIGSGLMVRSFLHMQELKSGLDPDRVLSGYVTLPVAVYPEREQRVRFFEELRAAASQLPSVVSMSGVSQLPLSDGSWTSSIAREGHPESHSSDLPLIHYNVTLPGYFATVGIPLKAGRDFSGADGSSSPHVAIVNETAARRLWPGENPLGKRFNHGDADTTGWTSVVGVVGDVRQNMHDAKRIEEIFVPHTQLPMQTMSLVLRTHGDPAALAAPMRRLIRERDADLAMYEASTLREHIRRASWEPRLYAQLMGTFSLIALLIAALGIYGVMAYSVARRTHEIGIRMALGAARQDVVRMVVGQAVRMTVLGIGVGLAVAFGLTRMMASLLFGVSAGDPPTFVGVTLILAFSSLLAAWLPAMRATRVDPIVALRHE